MCQLLAALVATDEDKLSIANREPGMEICGVITP